jgi:putative peptidoglycan lipid II flippase
VSKKPLKSTFIVGGSTFVSRIFGYVRDAVIFITFGTSASTDAFFVAFRIPNFLRRLFAEGAFSQAFVPVMSAHLYEGENQFKRLIDHVTGILSVTLLIITTIGILTAPLLIRIFAPGFDDPDQQVLASDMLKITFPYLFFISLTALAASILNIRQKFAVPAFTPVLLNISLIGAAIWLAPHMQNPVTALAWGVLIAGVSQLLFQLPFLLQARGLPVPKLVGAKQGVNKIMKLMLPALFGSSIVQINLIINTMIASHLQVGSISWLYISDRFVELPLALFGIAMGTVTLPMLSKQFVAKQMDDFNQTMQWGMRLAVFIAVPAMTGLVVLAGPVIVSLVQYREFTAFDTQMATMSLIAYALGLPAFILIKILAPGFFARQDTKTPVKIGVIAMLIGITLNLFFIWLWKKQGWSGAHAGLALATSISAYVNAALLFTLLKRQQIIKTTQRWLKLLTAISLGSITMALCVWFVLPSMDTWNQWQTFARLGSLFGFILLGGSIYLFCLFALGIRPNQFQLQKS